MIASNAGVVASAFLQSKKKIPFTFFILTDLSQSTGIVEVEWSFARIVVNTLLK